MTDLKRVLKGLYAHGYLDCRSCPYWGAGHDGYSDCTGLAREAHSLLKKQEPRVLTLNEVEDKLDDIVWIEEPVCENLSANFAIIAAYSRKLNKVRAYFFNTSEKEFEYGEYNKTWRCWSQRPFDEQREAVGWYD